MDVHEHIDENCEHNWYILGEDDFIPNITREYEEYEMIIQNAQPTNECEKELASLGIMEQLALLSTAINILRKNLFPKKVKYEPVCVL